MTTKYLNKLYVAKLVTKEMTHKWVSKFNRLQDKIIKRNHNECINTRPTIN